GHHQYEFAYRDGERTPFAMRRDDGVVAGLFYDQVGSLRVVADLDDNVIKEVLYDPFGGIIEDTNPDLRLPLGFAGGLHDRDLGFVRFGWRDYDVRTGRWTAPDPIGNKGGDPDWYGYCLDDPVNGVDPAGLFSPFSQEQKDGLKQVMKDKLDDFGAFTNYPLDLFGCFPACHDMKEKKKELSEPPRKSGGADREIRTKKPEDITHVGTWWENVTKGLF
ncbi:RHS repeat domain-containing protein, partial [Pseudodesulfovibrio karagichevae]